MGQKPVIYLISGQGSDERIFQEIAWNNSEFDVEYIPYKIPNRGEDMESYAIRMAESIDTSRNFSLVGVSLGGMICTEIATFLNPEKVLLISSAKARNELPFSYRFQHYIPIYAMVPRGILKAGARIAQPLFEPDRKSHQAVFIAMLKAKDKTFMKRSIRMIVNWQRTEYPATIVHIHGDNDHTLPLRLVKADRIVKNGSHMMTLTRAQDVSAILNDLLK
jgi:pimeloyl-ACP methyl ester carboxylesterase